MLELLIGIPLTILAWKRGWKGWAILPLSLAFVAQFVCGFLIGAAASPGTTADDAAGTAIAVSLLIDLIAAAVLIGMIVKERKPKSSLTSQNANVRPPNSPTSPASSRVASGYQPARFCTGCRQELHDNAMFCRNCGQMVRRTLNSDAPLAGQHTQPMT